MPFKSDSHTRESVLKKESAQKLIIKNMHREASKLAVKEEIKPKQKMSKNMLKDKDFLDSI